MLKITQRIISQILRPQWSIFIRYSVSYLKEDYIDIGKQQKPKGMLTICPTPIGNLNDWSIRQDNALFGADVIACEDTRTTGLLLKLLKQKNIRENLYDIYGEKFDKKDEIELDEDEIQTADLIFQHSKELAITLPKLNEASYDSEDLKFYKNKKIESMQQRIKKNKQDQIDKLSELDSLNFNDKESRQNQNQKEQEQEQTEDNFSVSFPILIQISSQQDLYGVSAPFMFYLRDKIKIAKDKKGRGILISCHKFNEQRRVDRLVGMMKLGFNITLVSDAGTPTISDPGYLLVNKCIQNNIEISSIPGPNAISVSLSLSGFPSDRYTFFGFVSKQLSNREESLIESKKLGQTAVIFESALRLSQLLLSIDKIYGENQLVWIGFELTKLFEKKLRGPCRQLFEDLTNPKIIKQSHLKGEVTVIIAPYTEEYNEQLKTQSININQNDNLDEDDDNDIDQEKNTNQIEELVRKVEAIPLANILISNFNESQDRIIAQSLQDILRISKTKAFKIVKLVRHQKNLDQKKKLLRQSLGIGQFENL